MRLLFTVPRIGTGVEASREHYSPWECSAPVASNGSVLQIVLFFWGGGGITRMLYVIERRNANTHKHPHPHGPPNGRIVPRDKGQSMLSS